MKKRIEIDYTYRAINFDDDLATLVNTLVESELKSERPSRALENKYDKMYIETAGCEDHANRLLKILELNFPTYVFAAHVDCTANPDSKWWRVLARTKNGRTIQSAKIEVIRRAAKKILKNIANKYPEDIGEVLPDKTVTKGNASGVSGLLRSLLGL